VVVEPPLIEQLKTGKTAVFIIFQTEEAGIGIPISLAGFGQALAALQ
jgi:invasion protein IalB